ncbi:MAG: ribbon-helix-helix domain-containing protein [Rhodospirillaceae bacterium]
MSRFAGLKKAAPVAPASVEPPETIAAAPAQPAALKPTPGSRVGKRAIGGYFSPTMSKALHTLAIEQDVTVQALLGEALDDLFRKHGRSPFGER